MQKIPVLVIVGPTASGKTALSIACAKHIGAEIVSADSMQLYTGMDIATAKPNASEMQGVPHHMLGVLSPETPYSVASYVQDAGACIHDIHKRGKPVIVVGGTGLYIDSLLTNTQFTEIPTDFQLRARLQAEYDAVGGEAMLQKLAEFDPCTAARLHPNNQKRILRAFEVFSLTGQTMAALEQASRTGALPFAPTYLGIAFEDRAVLYDRVNRRVEAMLAAGLLEEARAFFQKQPATAAQAIGYKELKPYFDGELSLEEAVENIKRATRNYAKRQITWFKRNTQTHWLYPDVETPEAFLSKALKIAEAVKL